MMVRQYSEYLNELAISNSISFHVLVPGPVEGLSFIKASPTLLQITWSSPSVTNGVIQSYMVQVERYDGLVFSDNIDGEQTSVLIPNLSKKFFFLFK